MDDKYKIITLFDILEELYAREVSNNCLSKYGVVSWQDLCDKDIELFKSLKEPYEQ